jgi:phosphohistidine swiveling domain-containing protein
MPYDQPIYEFDEEFDLEHYKVWVLGTQWFPPPQHPLFVDLHFSFGLYGLNWAPAMLSDPRTKGWDVRMRQGALYLSIMETSEEEKKQLEPIWREKMRKILEDPWAVWEDRKHNLHKKLFSFVAVDLKGLSDMELVDHWYEVWNYDKYVEECHFYPMYALGQGNIVFRRLLKQMLNISPQDQIYSELHSGFENEFMKITEDMSKLADIAIELNLQGVFSDVPLDQVLAKLATAEAGQQWIEQFNKFVKKHGYMRRRQMELCTPTWWEDNTQALADIQRFVAAGKGSRSCEARPRLVERRKQREEEILAKVPLDEREAFMKLMVCSQASSVFSEEHTLYCETLCYTVIRLAAIELGRRFVAKGMMDSPEDVMFLQGHEIVHAGRVQEKCNLRKHVIKRKEEYARYRRIENTHPMLLGDPTKLGEIVDADVIFSVMVAPPIARPEEVGATLVGCAGAPGVVEGTAVVCMGEEEMDNVFPGAILVVPATAASWTPVFNIIKGVVTDGGGYLTHALIIAREFGIPAVIGTQDGTRKIKTGQHIKIDGNLCRVWVDELALND